MTFFVCFSHIFGHRHRQFPTCAFIFPIFTIVFLVALHIGFPFVRLLLGVWPSQGVVGVVDLAVNLLYPRFEVSHDVPGLCILRTLEPLDIVTAEQVKLTLATDSYIIAFSLAAPDGTGDLQIRVRIPEVEPQGEATFYCYVHCVRNKSLGNSLQVVCTQSANCLVITLFLLVAVAGLEPATIAAPFMTAHNLPVWPHWAYVLPLHHTASYLYHAQRISCAIQIFRLSLNYVACQAATDGRAFQLTPFSLSLCSPFLDIGAACRLRH